MKKIYTKIIALCLMTALVFTACGQSEDTLKENSKKTEQQESNLLTPSGEYPITKEPLKMTIGVVSQPTVENFDTNAYTKYLEEETGIDLEFSMLLPNKKNNEKLAIMINANDELPEIIIGATLQNYEVAKYGSQGVFLPLNDMIEEHSVHFNKFFEGHEEDYKYFTSPDGNIYTMPHAVQQLGNMYALRAWINKVWLDNLGLNMPKTTDELKYVLQQFKEKDANGDGNKADEIPMTGCTSIWYGQAESWIMNAFEYDDTKDRLISNNGKVEAVYTKDSFKEGLKYLNGLAKEGLFSSSNFTQDKASLRQTLVAGGDHNMVGLFVTGGIMFPQGDEKIKEYVPLEPVKGPNGVQYTAYGAPVPVPRAFITKYCKNQEAAFRLLDFMYKEESTMRARYGVPGEDWVPIKDGEVGMFEESMGIKGKFREINRPWTMKTQNQHWRTTSIVGRRSDISDAIVIPEDKTSIEYLISTHVPVNSKHKPADDMIIPKLLYSEEDLDELEDIHVTINEFVKEKYAEIVIASEDVDKDWEKFQKDLKNMGIDTYLEISQRCWDRMNK